MPSYIPNAGQTGYDSGLALGGLYNQNLLQASRQASDHAHDTVNRVFEALQKFKLIANNINPNTGQPGGYSPAQIDTAKREWLPRYRDAVRYGSPEVSYNPEADLPTSQTSPTRGPNPFAHLMPGATQQQPTQQQPTQSQPPAQQPVQQQPTQQPVQPTPAQTPLQLGITPNSNAGAWTTGGFFNRTAPNFNQGQYRQPGHP